ncbi:MAG: hypothetical protein M1825_001810 [Sarcosagium campestre]|nr:MAG: hypothetical protein M1825_001810 [Sarcosagium campestre]
MQWTLRFKNKKTTVVLFAERTDSFRNIKTELLRMLQSLQATHNLGDTAPSDPDAIILGVPKDPSDLQKGWKRLEIPTDGSEDAQPMKGKKVVGNKSLDCPEGAKLQDGATLAFRYRANLNGTKGNAFNGSDDDELSDLDEEDDFDVVIPTFEDDGGE